MENVSNKAALIIFTKNPVLGKVKTRVAKDAGDEKALEIYKELLTITRALAVSVKCDVLVYYSDKIVSDEWDTILCHKKQQVGDDLGQRMSQAFKESFDEYDRLFLIGSDCPYINSETVHEAFSVLNTHDLVLGPVTDGGYFGIGMNKHVPEVFQDVTWSSEHVLGQTIEIADNLDMEISLLDTLDDIDHYDDWLIYQSSTGL